jgi:hypothetical protein
MDEDGASLREALIILEITKSEFILKILALFSQAHISSGSSRWSSFVENWLKIFPPR